MLLHSSLETAERALELYSSEAGLVAIGIGAESRPKLEERLGRFYDGLRIYPAEAGHDLYRAQLEEYFAGRRRVFEFPLDLRGSAFQKSVWSAVADIPFGHTATYGEIAQLIGRPAASRAVGAANGQNPLPIVVPCHRVGPRTKAAGSRKSSLRPSRGPVGSDGSLTGGLSLKRQLLALEGLLEPPAVQMRLF